MISTNLKGTLTIKAGQAIELTKTAKVSGNVVVKPGGALDVEGATISGSLNAKEAALLRICGAKAAKATVTSSTGSVVIGEGNEECPSSKFGGAVTIKANKAGVLIDENTFGSVSESAQQRRRHDGDQQQSRRRTGRQRQHRDGRRHAQRSRR